MRGRTPWRDARLVAVDVEATGLDTRRDRVISFGAVPIEGGRILAGDAVYGLVNPRREIPAESIVIHGIRPQELLEAPELPEALRPLAGLVQGAEVIAHAEWVERRFLTAPLRSLGVRLPRTLLDTAQMFRLHEIELGRPDPGLCSLASIAERLGLPAHRPHHALGDALTTAQVFLALATHLEARGRGTLRHFRSAGQVMQTHGLYNP